MSDWQWLDEIHARMILNGRRLNPMTTDFNQDAYKDPEWTDIAKLIETVKVMSETLERQQYPHIEEFCKQRAREALEKCK